MISSNEFTLKKALELMLVQNNLKTKYDEIHIRSIWDKLMGVTIAKRTIDINLHNKVLFLKLSSSVLRNELTFSKEKIMKLLNDEFGETVVESVIIK